MQQKKGSSFKTFLIEMLKLGHKNNHAPIRATVAFDSQEQLDDIYTVLIIFRDVWRVQEAFRAYLPQGVTEVLLESVKKGIGEHKA